MIAFVFIFLLLRVLKRIFLYLVDYFYILFQSFLICDYLLLSSYDGDDNNDNSYYDDDISSNIDEKLKNLNKTEKETLEMLEGLELDRKNAEKALKLLPDKHKPEIKNKIDNILDEIENNPITQNEDFLDENTNIEEVLPEFIDSTIESVKEYQDDLKEIQDTKKELEEMKKKELDEDMDSSGSITPTQESYNAEIARARATAVSRHSPSQEPPRENPFSYSSTTEDQPRSDNKRSLTKDYSNIDSKGLNNNLPDSELKGLEDSKGLNNNLPDSELKGLEDTYLESLLE